MSEVLKDKIPVLHFKPEGYISTGDIEFFEQLKAMLELRGYNPAELVYSGFDGAFLLKLEGETPKPKSIFAMNEAGWRKAMAQFEQNPAQYAEGWDVPCIGVYDRARLRNVYGGQIAEDNPDRVEIKEVELADPLKDLDPDEEVMEMVVHVNYPDSSTSEALLCLVLLDG